MASVVRVGKHIFKLRLIMFVFHQIFAKPFMSQETTQLQTLKVDYIHSLTKDLQRHQTVLFGKIPQETALSSLMEILMVGELVIKKI